MLSFASICPHPPIIIPTIGSSSDLELVKRTIKAMEDLREGFERKEIESLIIISPHGPISEREMTLNKREQLYGDLIMFGDFSSQFNFENDKEICEKIEEECRKEQVPLRTIEANLDHGCLVPLFYLTKTIKPKIVPLGYSFLDRESHFLFGNILGRMAKDSKKRVGIVASGDLSHRLFPGAPAGYSPRGKEFDKKLIELLEKKDIERILNMDENLIEEAGECGYRSIVILLGAISEFKISDLEFQILSYEGPFGVGYLVANIKGL